MPASLARLVVRKRCLVIVAAVLFMAIAGTFGGSVAKHLSNGGFDDRHAESSRARRFVDSEFKGGTPNLVLLVTATDGRVDSPISAAAGRALTAELGREHGVGGVASYWTLQAAPLKSNSGDRALVLARIAGSEDEVRARIEQISPRFTRTATGQPLTVGVTGEAEVFRQVGTTIENDLARAEMIAVPITLVLLAFVFGGLVAASLPLLVGMLTVLGTFLVLQIINSITNVSIFALNLTTAMGLGLAIDYALFMISRYREELAAGWPVADAVVRTVRTAGRTVVFSAATVAISLSALLVFNQSFLRSFAYAGVAVAAIAAIASVVVLPAVLAALGHRVDALRLRRRGPAKAVAGENGIWHRVAMGVMRRPGRVAASASLLLLLLGAPFMHIRLSLSDHRVLPSSATARTSLETIDREFGSRESSTAEVVVPSFDRATQAEALTSYAQSLSKLDGVTRVDTFAGSFIGGRQVAPANAASARFDGKRATWMSIVSNVEPVSAAGERLVKAIRGVPAPFATEVGGASAQLVDSKASLFARMPYAAGIIALVTFVLLFLMFGGLLVPLKALVLNALSLSATFGAMVFVFQEGHGSGFFNFTATGALDATTPILMFCIAFGLSMDYEVFLLSRIKEEHDRTGDNTRSVAMGLERTGRIVTAAALLISIVFIAFSTSGITFIKLFGVGLAFAVLMDAFVIRATLVPAFMRLAGEANWWAPAPLRRIQQRIGLSEHVELEGLPAGLDAPSRASV